MGARNPLKRSMDKGDGAGVAGTGTFGGGDLLTDGPFSHSFQSFPGPTV